MKRLSQTQVLSKSLIRKVNANANAKKNMKRNSTSIENYNRQNSVPDSPRFGTEMPSDSQH